MDCVAICVIVSAFSTRRMRKQRRWQFKRALRDFVLRCCKPRDEPWLQFRETIGFKLVNVFRKIFLAKKEEENNKQPEKQDHLLKSEWLKLQPHLFFAPLNQKQPAANSNHYFRCEI